MTKNAVTRATETMYLRVSPAARAQAFADAERLGLTVSEMVEQMIFGSTPTPKPDFAAGPLAIVGSQCLAAIDALPPDATEARSAVTHLRHAIVEQLLDLRPEYVARAEGRGAEQWD